MNTAVNPFDLHGRVALVTGGSRGLGREMVLAFARSGADVAIASRKIDGCERVADEVLRATGRSASAHACHVGHWGALEALVDSVYQRFGRLDVLVNNAGIAPLYDRLTDVSEGLFDKVIAVNLKGPFRLAALAGERMKEAGSGSIINISSVAATRPTPGELPYAMAKAGLNTLTIGLARALGPEVRANTIMAGPFLTDIAAGWDMDSFERNSSAYPLRRAGTPSEIVGAALYLASDAASFTTGSLIAVDGGMAVAR